MITRNYCFDYVAFCFSGSYLHKRNVDLDEDSHGHAAEDSHAHEEEADHVTEP